MSMHAEGNKPSCAPHNCGSIETTHDNHHHYHPDTHNRNCNHNRNRKRRTEYNRGGGGSEVGRDAGGQAKTIRLGSDKRPTGFHVPQTQRVVGRAGDKRRGIVANVAAPYGTIVTVERPETLAIV